MALGRARRVAVVGDAAFVARPHVGMGVTKAAGDAAALLDAFVESGWDVPAALARFDRARHPCGAAIVDRARALGAYMQAQRRMHKLGNAIWPNVIAIRPRFWPRRPLRPTSPASL